MEYFNNLFAQIRDLFSGMTPGSRIIAGLLLAVLVISLAMLVAGTGGFGSSASGSDVLLYDGYIFKGVEQRAADAAFAAAKLKDYDFKAGRLYVPAKKKFDYIACLAEANVIKESDAELDKLISGITALDSQLTANSKVFHGAQRRLADTIKRWSNIENATVEAYEYIGRAEGRFDKTKIRTATVTVWPTTSGPLPDKLISAITGTVKRGLAISDIKNITITNGNTGEAYPGTEENLIGGEKTLAGEIRKHTEHWESVIRDALAYIPGARVKVGVDVEPIEKSTRLVVRHDPPSSAVHERTQTTNFQRDDERRQGRPGYVAQANTPLNLDMARGISSTGKQREETSNEERTNALQGQERNLVDSPFPLRRVTASINVPQSYFRTVWQLRNKPAADSGTAEAAEPTDAEIQLIKTEVINDIKLNVANLLYAYRDPLDPDPTHGVEVIAYDDIQIAPPASPSFGEQVTIFLSEQWQTLGLLGLVLGGLLVLWSISRPAKPEPIVIYEAPEIPAEVLEERYAPTTAEEEEEIERQRSLNSFDKSMRSLQEEVAELVEENPDAAAAVLRQWIGTVTSNNEK